MSSRVAIETAALADLSVDVGTLVRVFAVERHAVEGGGEPLRLVIAREEVEALVRPLGPALAGELAPRRLLVPLEGEDARRVGILAGKVLLQAEPKDVSPVLEARQRDLGDAVAAEARGRRGDADLAVAHLEGDLVAGVAFNDLGPALDELPVGVVELLAQRVELRRQSLGGVGHEGPRAVELIEAPGESDLGGLALTRRAGQLDDLAEVAHPGCRG